MYAKILVASDLTEASQPALRTAIELGRRLGATLTALHVIEPAYQANHWFVPHIGADAEALASLIDRELGAARAKLDGQLKALDAPDSTELHVLIGRPAQTIVDTAKNLGFDLLVVGTHARKGLEHAILGSVAERVVRTSLVPVLTVRAG